MVFFQRMILFGIVLIFSSCGRSDLNLVEKIHVHQEISNDEVVVSTKFQIKADQFLLPLYSYPILHPDNHDSLGFVTLGHTDKKSNFVWIELNLSKMTGLDRKVRTLANGNPIPILSNTKLIKLPIGPLGELFVGLGPLGVGLFFSLKIKQFDKIGQDIKISNYFSVFEKDKLMATVGLFTSSLKGENGLGFGVDISPRVDLDKIYPKEEEALLIKSALIDEDLTTSKIEFDYSSHIPKNDVLKKLLKFYDKSPKQYKLSL